MSEEIVNQNSEQEKTDVESMLMDAAENAVTQSDEEKKEQEIKLGDSLHESHTDRRAISSILRKYKDGTIKLPLAQRMYVWNEKQRKSLLRTAKKGYGCGCLSLATHEGDSDEVSYLVDGQQRLISMMMLSNDQTLTSEERKIVLNYQMPIVIVYQLSWEEISEWFLAINSGVPVASVIKERSKLPVKLNNLILNTSRNEFFQSIGEKANATFRKSQHHEIIAENILLANAGVKVGSIKAKEIFKKLRENEADVYSNTEKANLIVERLKNIYTELPDDIIKRSMNATFISVLVYIMHDYPEIKEQSYVDLVKYVFANKRAIKAYTIASGRDSSSEYNCKQRYDILLNLLNNPPKQQSAFDEDAYHTFVQRNNGKVINTNDCDHPIDFEDIEEEDRKRLYIACDVEKDHHKYEDIIVEVYNRLCDEHPDEADNSVA